MERRSQSEEDVGAFGLRRNDVAGALAAWLQELRAGRSCYETTNMLLHMQDDPDELLAAMAKASRSDGVSVNQFPADDTELVAALQTTSGGR